MMLRSLPTLLQEVDSAAFVKLILQRFMDQQPADENDWQQTLASTAVACDQRQWTQDAMQLLVNEMQHYDMWNEAQQNQTIWQRLEQSQLHDWFTKSR